MVSLLLILLATSIASAASGYRPVLEIHRRYDAHYTERLYIDGTWVYPDGIAERFEAQIDALHRCDVRQVLQQGVWYSYGLRQIDFHLKVHRNGHVLSVDYDGEPKADTDRQALTCLTDHLESLTFPVSRGRPTDITFTYSGPMESIHDPLPSDSP